MCVGGGGMLVPVGVVDVVAPPLVLLPACIMKELGEPDSHTQLLATLALVSYLQAGRTLCCCDTVLLLSWCWLHLRFCIPAKMRGGRCCAFCVTATRSLEKL